MVAQVNPAPATTPKQAAAPGSAAGAALSVELAAARALFSDTLQLAALEARHAIGSAAQALLLFLMAVIGAMTAAVIAIVALVFALQSLGMPWALALLLVAVTVAGLCYLAVRTSGRLLRRLTLPQTRRAMAAGPENQ